MNESINHLCYIQKVLAASEALRELKFILMFIVNKAK